MSNNHRHDAISAAVGGTTSVNLNGTLTANTNSISTIITDAITTSETTDYSEGYIFKNTIGVIKRTDDMRYSTFITTSGKIEERREKNKLTNKQKLDYKNIEKIIFNKPATIIIFKDGTKEVAKCYDEDFDEEKGVAMIMLNLVFNNNKSERKRFIEKFIVETKDSRK